MRPVSSNQKAFHAFLSVLYFFVSFYVVICPFHHDLLESEFHLQDTATPSAPPPSPMDMAGMHHAMPGMDHHAGRHSGKNQDSGGIFCKFVQKISSSAIAGSSMVVSQFFLPFQTAFSLPTRVVVRFVDQTHPSRAPPLL